jgi:RimJ/RimL family protein N-acetyltransferase
MNNVLETDRLLLRPFKLGDETAVLEFASNKQTQAYTGTECIESLEEAHLLIVNVWLEDYKRYSYGRLAVIHKEDNKIIGFNGIKYLPEIQKTDLGYRFLPEYWRQGLATESSKIIIDDCFTTKNISEIIAFVMPENPASSRVLEKLNFTHTTTQPYPRETKDLYWYTLTKENYER